MKASLDQIQEEGVITEAIYNGVVEAYR